MGYGSFFIDVSKNKRVVSIPFICGGSLLLGVLGAYFRSYGIHFSPYEVVGLCSSL